ncbi:MAG: cytochrome [Massilia sp.]|nr:cytochrome [Massilia sp.]
MPSNRTRLILKTAAATLVLAGVAGAIGGAVVLRAGWYDIGASAQHLQPVYTLLEQGMHYSVRRHARAVAVPPLGAPAQVARGALLYSAHCAQCHGGPGFAQSTIGQSMQPLPGPLVDASARWQPRELYWITRHGIKMSGMPAWEFHLGEDDLWAVVAFMGVLPTLSARDYAAVSAPAAAPVATPVATPGRAPAAPPSQGQRVASTLQGDPERGRAALAQHACRACHMIPGLSGPETYVGRPLAGLAERRFIAGGLPNNQATLVRWIRDPQAIDPHTAMPAMGVSERDALDMSAWLLRPGK